MIISLDRVALKELIDKDPEFELSLKNAVLSEVGRRLFEKDSARVIREANKDIFDKIVSALHADATLVAKITEGLDKALIERTRNFPFSSAKLSPEAKKEIENRVAILKDEILRKAANEVSTTYSNLIQKAVDDRIADAAIDERVEKRVNRLTEEEINRRVDAKFKERMDAFAKLAAAE